MNIKEFAAEHNITVAKVRELCNSAFGEVPENLTELQINRLKADLNSTEFEPSNIKSIAPIRQESSGLRKKPRSSGTIALNEDYQKLYNLVPQEFQRQLDRLPECDRVGVLLAAIEGIEAAEVKFLTSQSFEQARLNQLQNQANNSRINQHQNRTRQRDDFSDFDVQEFIQKLEAEELLKAMLGGRL